MATLNTNSPSKTARAQKIMLLPDFFMDGLVKTTIVKMFPTIPRIPNVLRNTPHITFSEFPPFGWSGHTKPVHSSSFPTVKAKVKNTEATKMNNKIVIRIVAVDGLGFIFLR